MKVLVAEDDAAMCELYLIALQSRGHAVVATHDGGQCVDEYKKALLSGPFDVVVLDYRMPRVDGLEAAKEILRLKKNQRIIFASAYVKETLMDSVKHLEQVVELIQKPFEPKVLVDLIEDTSTTRELKEINKLVAALEPGKPNDEQISELLDVLKKIQKIGF
jgi:DNA-binding response OmpR family regulator